jgi:N-acetylglucosamine kinase-like BadF-type ATPase
VSAAANAGDALAAIVLRHGGSELAALTKIVLTRIFSDADTVLVAMSGGVFANSALVREVFYNELRARCPQVVMDEKIANPVQGALDLARSRTG